MMLANLVVDILYRNENQLIGSRKDKTDIRMKNLN